MRPHLNEAERIKLALKTFAMRKAGRDEKADRERLAQVIAAIDSSIQQTDAERSGLIERIRRTVDQPEAVSKEMLSRLGAPSITPAAELALAEARLRHLAKQVTDLQAIKASLLQLAK